MREPELKPILSTKGEARSQESTAKWSPLSSALFTEKQDVRAPESHGTSSRKVKKVKSQDIRRIPFSIGGISEPTCGGSAEETYTPQRPQYRIPPPRQPSVALVSARQTQPQQELVSHDHPLLSHPTEAWWQSTQGSLSRRISLRGQGGKRNTMLKESPRKQTSSQNVTRSDSLQQGQRSASRQISVQQRATERSRIPQASLSDSLTIYTINQNEPSASQPRPSNNHDTRQEVCPQVTETHIRRESRTAGAITLMRWKTDEGSSSKPSKQ
ncbi:MAG: hypothetical protein MMC33_000961 [Icmadophila ericetorum]|nr:hypothetical protein [Icmadophila ericetorum]